MESLKSYHNNKKDILVTIADIVNTREQARDLLQNIPFDTTRVRQSSSCIRTTLDEINYTIQRLRQSELVIMGFTPKKFQLLSLSPLTTSQNNLYLLIYAC